MKRRNRLIKVTLISLIIITIITSICIIQKQSNHYYPMTTIVYKISNANDTVTIQDFNGNLWQFKGVEDWTEGDIASCIMNNKGTELIKDDEIVKVRYSGYFEKWKCGK